MSYSHSHLARICKDKDIEATMPISIQRDQARIYYLALTGVVSEPDIQTAAHELTAQLSATGDTLEVLLLEPMQLQNPLSAAKLAGLAPFQQATHWIVIGDKRTALVFVERLRQQAVGSTLAIAGSLPRGLQQARELMGVSSAAPHSHE
jgi:hypothetical protein